MFKENYAVRKNPVLHFAEVLLKGLTLGRHASACATILRLHALLYLRALVYCNFLRKVRLGGWGSRGPKGPT